MRSARDIISTIAWGIFCACSWTWCIGMFLPKVMLDRYGVAGFLVFAIPNVIGCAGFGYFIATRSRSERLCRDHRSAMLVFSAVAIAFHAFFITLLFHEGAFGLTDTPSAAMGAAGLLLAATIFLAILPRMIWLPAAIAVYALSLTAFAVTGFDAPLAPTPDAAWSSLPWLAPVIVIGFLLCPALDLTFHRALQRSPSRHAFSVFGLTFMVMIIMTCSIWYAETPPRGLVLGHLFGQAIFTCGAHAREIVERSPSPRSRLALLAAPVLGLLILPATHLLGLGDSSAIPMYLRFMVWYGLLFPAYVLVFMGPWTPVTLSRTALVRLGAVAIVMMPLFEVAFIRDVGWLMVVPTTAVVTWAISRRTQAVQ